jgi:chorismate mutase
LYYFVKWTIIFIIIMNLSIAPLVEWGLPIQDIFLIAGPCSAESEEQLLETAKKLKDNDISFFRAGIWKPRTHPGSFEGVGIKGLRWLAKVKEITSLPVGTEVAIPEHVKACIKYNIDVLWIGARTTPNPFAVQALADILKDTDLPVFVKNPISPDLELWIGAIERLYNAGIKKIGAIHRGFSTPRKVLYRYSPNWKIPIELKRRIPEIPILCDPSHICGRSELIFSIAQEAMDLLYDGLMVEVHINPAEALSDSKQQLTPEQFQSLTHRLTLKRELSNNEEYRIRIKELRSEIDDIDEHIIQLLGKRMDIARKMGILKKMNNISILQPHRWTEILKSRLFSAIDYNLSEDFTFHLFQLIHEEAIQQQEPDTNK